MYLLFFLTEHVFPIYIFLVVTCIYYLFIIYIFILFF